PPPRPTLFPYTTLFRSEKLALIAVAAGAIHELAGQTAGIEDALAVLERLLGLGGGLAGLGRQDHLLHDLVRRRRILLQVCGEVLDRKSTRLNSSHVKIS